MPVIKFEIAELERLLRKDVPRAELAKTIPMIGADVEDSSGATWAVEFFPDRPDLFTVEGIARALRAWYGVESGLRKYPTRPSGQSVKVDPSVASVRPHIAAAFVRGVDITQARLDALIGLQEDLHWGLGARRRRVAIGIHDAKTLAPPFTYTTWGLDEKSFVPLYETREMTPREILTKHEKGTAYAHLLAGHERVPIIVDSRGGVVSLPPIINAARTAVTTATRDIFLDVTGTDRWAVERTLNMLATALVEAGGTLETVDVGGKASPDLTPETKELAVAEANALLGTSLSPDEVARALQRMGFGARVDGDSLDVDVPPYRADILHTWDLVEDVAIGHGFANLTALPLRARTVGMALPENKLAENARRSLVGLGFLETMNLTLSNERDQFARMQRPASPVVKVLNPVTEDVTLLRPTLLPGLMAILKKNAHRDLPQRLFEVGMVTRRDGDHVHNERHVAGVIIAGRSSFSEIKGVVLALARDLGWPEGGGSEGGGVAKSDDPAFLTGRAAGFAGRGVFGEVSPAVLDAFGLAHPVTAFELTLARGPGDAVRDGRA